MREDEVDSVVEADLAQADWEEAEDIKLIVKGLTKVFETVFADFRASIDVAVEGYSYGDPRKDALYSMQAAIDYMDIAYTVRKALKVPL